jgi:plasmid stability protein
MGAVLIRGIDEGLKSKLRLRPAKHGVSMEQEVRTILDHELKVEPSPGNEHPVRAIRRYVEEHGGWDDVKFVRIRSKARAPKFDGGAQVDCSGYKCGFGNRQAAVVRAGDELALPKAGYRFVHHECYRGGDPIWNFARVYREAAGGSPAIRP